MHKAARYHFALALKEMRSAVAACCWVLGIALLAQTVIWSLMTFTDLRYVDLEPSGADHPTAVVAAESSHPGPIRDAGHTGSGFDPIDVNRQLTTTDHIFRVTTTVGGSLGIMAAFALLPLIALAVVLGAAGATPGIERAAGAFAWSIALVVLVLPLGRLFDLMPFEGVFAAYDAMARDTEFVRTGARPLGIEHAASAGLLFYGRYCVLPLACLAAIGAITMRFRAGTEAGLVPKTDYHLDPALEKEVAGLKASSLKGGGGRTVGALRNAMKIEEGEFQRQEPSTMRKISAGERPARPI